MAVAITEPVAEVASTANASTYASGSFTPTADSLLVVIAFATSTNNGVITGGGLTWTNRFFDGSGTSVALIATAQVGGAPGSMTVTFDCTGDAATGCAFTVFQVTGHNASVPLAQASTGLSSFGTGATPAVTLAAARNTLNAYMAGAFNVTNPAGIAQPSGWTETADTGYSTPTIGMETAFRAGGETSATITWGGVSASAGSAYAIEINEASLPAAPTTVPNSLMLMGVGT